MLQLRLCALAQLKQDASCVFTLPELDDPVIAVLRGDRIAAFSSRCPHGDVSLARGTIEGDEIVCPGHGYRFHLATGRCSAGPAWCLVTFEVSVVDDQVLIGLPPQLGPLC